MVVKINMNHCPPPTTPHFPPTSLRQCFSIQGIYVTRVNYTSADHAKQVSTLLYCMGRARRGRNASVYKHFRRRSRAVYDRFLAHFHSSFKVLRNVIFERAKFNRRAQQRGQSVEQFITALDHLAETVPYAMKCCVVGGIADSSLYQSAFR